MQIMTLHKLLLTFYPESKTLFHKQTREEPTNLFIDGWCRSSVELYLLASAAPSKKRSCNQDKTMHACYCSTRGLEIKHKSHKHIRLMYLGREKYLFINLNMNQLTMILETGHRSSILILGSSSSLSSNCFA
jgi:hypothetical protein